MKSGLEATTLNYDYEVRAAEDAFADVPSIKIKGEMLELAKHIIDTKRGDFDPVAFHDRYEEALAELVKAKLEGRDHRGAEAAEAAARRRPDGGAARKRGPRLEGAVGPGAEEARGAARRGRGGKPAQEGELERWRSSSTAPSATSP